MSKLLVKGGPLGGGTVVLESPDTGNDYTLTLPAKSGTVSVLDDATGSPVMADGTPVVESGSNSDGEWTRWGDGTAIASSPSILVGAQEAFGSIYRTGDNVRWDYPTSFTYATGAGESGDVGGAVVGGQAGSYSYFSFRVMSGVSLSPKSARISVQGRWK